MADTVGSSRVIGARTMHGISSPLGDRDSQRGGREAMQKRGSAILETISTVSVFVIISSGGNFAISGLTAWGC